MRAALLTWLIGSDAFAQSALPDPRVTPGALNPAVTPLTMTTTDLRPRLDAHRSTAEPIHELPETSAAPCARLAGSANARLRRGSLGPVGAGWRTCGPAQPLAAAKARSGRLTAAEKNVLEDVLHRNVCGGTMSLYTAQRAMLEDWTAAYWRYVKAAPE